MRINPSDILFIVLSALACLGLMLILGGLLASPFSA